MARFTILLTALASHTVTGVSLRHASAPNVSNRSVVPAVVRQFSANSSSHVVVSGIGRSNSTQQFRPAEVGACRCIYYSSYQNEKITTVTVIDGPTQLASVPADPSGSNWYMPPRGDCWLVLDTNSNYKTDQDWANLRLAELSLCGMYSLSKPSQCAPFCKVTLRVPKPYNNDDDPDPASCIAAAAYSKMTGRSYNSNDVALVGGLTGQEGSVSLKSVSGVPGIIQMKLEAAYVKGYSVAIIPQADESTYHETEYYRKRHDVLFWNHEFSVRTCADMDCVAGTAFV